jgi:hypothetical protein
MQFEDSGAGIPNGVCGLGSIKIKYSAVRDLSSGEMAKQDSSMGQDGPVRAPGPEQRAETVI